MQGRSKAMNARQSKVPLPLVAKRTRRSKECASKNRSGDKRNLEREQNIDSFNVAAGFDNRRSRGDTILEHDRAVYWRRPPVVLTALHGTSETRVF